MSIVGGLVKPRLPVLRQIAHNAKGREHTEHTVVTRMKPRTSKKRTPIRSCLMTNAPDTQDLVLGGALSDYEKHIQGPLYL